MFGSTQNAVRALCMTFGLMASAPTVQASPITVTFEGVNPGSGSAGQYNWNTGATTYTGLLYTPFANGSTFANHFITFCLEKDQFISGGQTYNDYHFTSLGNAPTPGQPMLPATAAAIASMWAQYRSSVDTPNESAAFQQAIWHLLNEDYNPSLSGSQLMFYNSYLNSSSWLSGLANLAAMVNGTRQDQVFELEDGYIVNDNGDIVPTPAPATIVVALMLAPAALLRRRATRVQVN